LKELGGAAIDAGADALGDAIGGKGKDIVKKLKDPVKKVAKGGLAKGADALDGAIMGKPGKTGKKPKKKGKKLKVKAPKKIKKVKKLKLMKKKKIA